MSSGLVFLRLIEFSDDEVEVVEAVGIRSISWLGRPRG